MRNYNTTASGGGANFAIQNRKQSFHKQKYGTNYQVAATETVADGKIEWIFNRMGEDLQVGHTWTLFAKIKLNENVKLDSFTWRAYCETKQPAPLISWYYFKSWMVVRTLLERDLLLLLLMLPLLSVCLRHCSLSLALFGFSSIST